MGQTDLGGSVSRAMIAILAVGVSLAETRSGSTGALARRPGSGSGAGTTSLQSAGTVVVLATLLVPGICAGQLPPDIMADKYLLQAEQFIRDEDYAGARAAMEKLLSLQEEHGLEPAPEDHFRYAKAWQSSGAPGRVLESLVRYLQLRGREAEHYTEALELMNRAEADKKRAEAEPAVTDRGPGAGPAGMEFVRIPAGEFLMGSTSAEAFDGEQPVTQVRIWQAFDLGKYEVTHAEWQAVMGTNSSGFYGCRRCPVEMVSWEDVQEFIRRLNGRERGSRYRLPTEAEWEYAARAGTTEDRYAAKLDAIAWYGENSRNRTHPVGQKAPNAFGLHDILGNVWEWVQDWYGRYPGGSVTDPRGPGAGSSRVKRGGCWFHVARNCRSSHRSTYGPGVRHADLGFRLLRTAN